MQDADPVEEEDDDLAEEEDGDEDGNEEDEKEDGEQDMPDLPHPETEVHAAPQDPGLLSTQPPQAKPSPPMQTSHLACARYLKGLTPI